MAVGGQTVTVRGATVQGFAVGLTALSGTASLTLDDVILTANPSAGHVTGVASLSFSADTKFGLTDNELRAVGFGTLALSGVSSVHLAGGAGDNGFLITEWTGGGSLTGGSGLDTVAVINDVDFTLANTSLATDDGMHFALSGIANALLLGGAGDNRFDVSGWTAGGLMSGGAGFDVVRAAKDVEFDLRDEWFDTSDRMAVVLSDIESAELIGGTADNGFYVSEWTGLGMLTGAAGVNTVVAEKAGNFVLHDAYLATGDGMAIGLSGVTNAKLFGDSGVDRFNVGGWNAGGLLDGRGGANVAIATKDQEFVVADDFLSVNDVLRSVTGGLGVAMKDIRRVELFAGIRDNHFELDRWTGGGLLSGGIGHDTVAARRDVDFVLTDARLTASDGMDLELVSFGNAELFNGPTHSGFDIHGWTSGNYSIGTFDT